MRALAVALAGLAALAQPAAAQRAPTAQPLELTGQVSNDGTRIELAWPRAGRGMAQVLRRDLGATGPDSWQEIAPPAARLLMQDDLPPGVAQEYQVRIDGGDRPRIGYWVAGTDVPARPDQGIALLIVDDTLAGDLTPELDLFQSDLTGAGWQVRRHLSPRATGEGAEDISRAMALRRWITQEFRANAKTPHAIILVGRLPIPLTGRVNPDGHGPHAVPSDLFYADPDGFWPATQGPDGTPQLMPSLLPTGHIAMQIGRIDFAGLDDHFGGELPLLRAYFDRNHRWRHGLTGDPRRAYGASPHLLVERYALNNIVGPDHVVAGGHHDTGGGGPYLLGVDFGEWSGSTYDKLPPSEAIFTINFGSHKHRFDSRNNAMTALLAQPGPLAVGWGGRPSWQLNGMALGDSIGEVHLRTVNNAYPEQGGMAARNYQLTGEYDWLAPPWVNLLGDPTLRPFPLRPVADLRAETGAEGVTLHWTLPEGAEGALLFRADNRDGPYHPLAGGALVTGDSHLDAGAAPGAWYMVRAQGLAHVHAGSFHRLAQGVFLQAP